MLAIINGKIFTMAGETIENGKILSENGKIVSIGKDIEIPKEAEIIDAQGKIVTPGIIDGHSHIGIGEEGIGFEGMDYNEMSDPITPHMRAIDAIYPDDKGFLSARQGGITTVVTGPGSANAIGGSFVAMKTYGTRVDDMIIKNPAALKIAFGENIKRVYNNQNKAPKTRMGIMALMREFFYNAKDYMEKKELEDESKRPAFNLKYESVIPVLKGQVQVKAHAHRTDDIFSAIRLAKEFNLDLSLEHCTEGHLIAEDLAKEGYPVICGPNLSNASKYELRNRSFVTPAKLFEAGLKVAIMTDNSVIPTPHLPLCAGLAARSGLPEEEAFKAITINAAEITHIADKVGSLEVGKDADIVIWSHNPIKDIECEVLYTIIDGKVVYTNKDKKFGF